MNRRTGPVGSLDDFLEMAAIDLEVLLPGLIEQEPCAFYLNPRYLRGSDFLMRWSQGRWAEDVVVRAFDASEEFKAVPYGPSSVAPSDPTELERYFELLDAAGRTGKRPDLLLLTRKDYGDVRYQIERVGAHRIPFTPEESLRFLTSRSIVAVEVENSLWVATDMPDFGKGRPLRGHPEVIGFTKRQKIPTIIIKAEDISPLQQWQDQWKVPIYVFHVFYDQAYFLSFQRAVQLIEQGVITATRQTFQAPGGPTTHKDIYKFWYTLAQLLGVMTQAPTMAAKFIKDKNGHILPYVHFAGGELTLSQEILGTLRQQSR